MQNHAFHSLFNPTVFFWSSVISNHREGGGVPSQMPGLETELPFPPLPPPFSPWDNLSLLIVRSLVKWSLQINGGKTCECTISSQPKNFSKRIVLLVFDLLYAWPPDSPHEWPMSSPHDDHLMTQILYHCDNHD